MIKSVLATSVALVAGGSAFAAPNYIGPSIDITRGDAFAIRSCGDAYGALDSVCYNQTTTTALSIFDVPVAPIYRTVTRTVRVKCDTEFDRSDKTTRGQVAAEFCPQVEAGALDPAPFLM